MDVIALLVRSDLRRRWRSWVAVVLLVGVIGGTSMAAVAGHRRTSTAMDRFFRYHHPANAYARGQFDNDDLEAIPGVEAALGGDYFLMAPVDRDGQPHPEHLGMVSPFSVDSPEAGPSVSRPIIVDGALPDPDDPSQVTVDEEMADLYDLDAGDTLTMQAYGLDQADALFEAIGTLEPTGERFDLTVTAVTRSPQDVVPYLNETDVVYLGSAEVVLGPAFHREHQFVDVLSFGLFETGGEPAPSGVVGLEMRVDMSRTTRDEVRAAIQALDPDAFIDFSPSDAARATDEATRSIRLQAALLLALGGVVAVGGVVLIVQALRRQLDVDHEVHRSLGALGAPRSSAVRAALLKAALVGGSSAVVAVAVAVALSPLMPVGHARRAEIDRGLDSDPLVLLPGALTLLVLVAGFAVLAAWRRSSVRAPRQRANVAALSDRAAQAGLPPSVVAGVRAARLGAGGTTVLGTVFIAAVGIVGALGFAASEHRLATDPDLWGWTFDAVVGDGNDEGALDRAQRTLAGDPMVESYAARIGTDSVTLTSADAEVDLGASAIDDIEGTIEPAMLEGVPARADDELVLGAATARKLRVGVGDQLEVDTDGDPLPFTVTGLAVMNVGFDQDRIGEGVLFTLAGLEALEAEQDAAMVLVRYADGVDPDEAYAELREDWGHTVLRPIRSLDVEQLHYVRHLPLWFSVFLSAVAAATLAFVLIVTIRRRRHDLALLRTLGFDRRQLRSTVFVQSLALVLPGTILGIVGGLVVGRLAWSATVRGMGAPEVQVAPVAAVAGVLVAAVVLALGVAAVPGRLAAQTRPAQVLRTE